MKKPVLILFAVAVAVAAAWFFWPREGNDTQLVLYGNVDIREVQLGFRVAGRLDVMNLEEGDAVVTGQLMAALDSKPLQDNVDLAQARVAEAEAKLALLRSGSRPQEIKQARAREVEASAVLKNAHQEFDRQKDLVAKGVGNQHVLDSARSQRDQAQARLAASRESLALVVEGARREDIDAAKAALAATYAQLEQAKTQLADTQLRAPNAGVILTRVREPGAIVAIGMPVYALSLNDVTYVRAYVAEPALGRVVPGAKVKVATDSSTNVYRGQVGFISPRAEFTPKSVETPELRTDLVFRLRIVISDPDQSLRQGMPVTIRFDEA